MEGKSSHRFNKGGDIILRRKCISPTASGESSLWENDEKKTGQTQRVNCFVL